MVLILMKEGTLATCHFRTEVSYVCGTLKWFLKKGKKKNTIMTRATTKKIAQLASDIQ